MVTSHTLTAATLRKVHCPLERENLPFYAVRITGLGKAFCAAQLPAIIQDLLKQTYTKYMIIIDVGLVFDDQLN
jgi:hypothetical protein